MVVCRETIKFWEIPTSKSARRRENKKQDGFWDSVEAVSEGEMDVRSSPRHWRPVSTHVFSRVYVIEYGLTSVCSFFYLKPGVKGPLVR